MKNQLLVLSILPLLLGVTSCNNSYSKVNLLFGRETVTQLEDIKYGDLANMIDDEKNFIIASTPDSSCACWSTFKNQCLLPYAKENKLIVYTIPHKELEQAHDDNKSTFGIDYRSDRPTFLLFEDGKIKEQRVYESKDSIFKQLDSFKKYFDEKINLPNYYYVSLTELNKLYIEEESFNIYFSRSNCPDCAYVETHSLKEYAKKNPEFRNLYVLDCETIGIRVYDENNQLTPDSALAWQAFKDEYGLSTVNNPTFGYNTGYVPTFFSVTPKNGSKTEGITMGSVYFNDTVTKEDGKYIVSDSYYTSERLPSLTYASNVEKNVLKGMALSEDDVNSYFDGAYIAWKQEKAATYHDALLFAYLDSIK